MKRFQNPKVLLGISLFILFATTIYWATLGAIIQNHNADQLIDPLLFSNLDVFRGATFPAAHTFLLKWPLFALIAMFQNVEIAVIIVTVLLCIATVAGLFHIIYRIEKRPLVLAVLALSLASILLMIPAEPYPGALLPTNFAMLTTRNIEYIVFAYGIILLLKSGKWRIAGSLSLLTLLFASDRLFMMIGIGAGIVSLGLYWLSGHRQSLATLRRICIVIVVAAALNYGLLALISAANLTHFSHDSSGPYGLSFDIKEKVLAFIFAVLGILTNFGANPLYDATSWKDFLPVLFKRAASWSGIAYLINIIAVAIVSVWSIRLIRLPKKKVTKSTTKDDGAPLSLFLTAAAVVATLLFIFTNHYYPVDARYLTIYLVAVVAIVATFCVKVWKKPVIRPYVWVVLLISIACGIVTTYSQYQASSNAYTTDKSVNEIVRGALTQHPITTLIGDYWRVAPIAANLPFSVAIDPLGNCLESRGALTSRNWTENATSQDFAYLLTTTQTRTGFPACSLQDIQTAYGKPTRITVVKGKLPTPSEMLLFYDYGSHPKELKKPVTVVRPIDLLDAKGCPNNTIVQIVAHQDDDLLFMNPDLIHTLQKGDCVRTVYLTAGDSGSQKAYWIGREDGAMAAYAAALGVEHPHWTISPYQISPTAYAAVARLAESNGKISLYFLRLPDGGIDGKGFGQSGNESLARLYDGVIPGIHSVDGQSQYSKTQLIDTLSFLMKKYNPQQLRIQALTDEGKRYHDHSDHITSGKFAQLAYDSYSQSNPNSTITQYTGYPGHEHMPNITEPDLEMKSEMFYAYGMHDGATCTSDLSCRNTVYKYYLQRQYTQP